MLTLEHGRSFANCEGLSRRTALKVGVCSALGLSLPHLLRARAYGAATKGEKSVILLWLDGGPSQLETYDPKPLAPAEFRGPWGAIATKVSGIQICESLPLHASYADRMAFVRSLHHDNGDHFAAAHWMLTGKYGSNASDLGPKCPSIGSYVARTRGPMRNGIPTYVGLPAAHSVYIYPGYMGGAYLGPAYHPFDVQTEQKYLSANYNSPIQPPSFLASLKDVDAGRSGNRASLLANLDHARREIDQSGLMASMDKFQQQATNLLLSGQARQAFDIEQETAEVRDRYGRGPWGHYTLLARRLVEAGVGFVTVDMPHWDDHSNIEKGHGYKLPHVDKAVAGLMQDLTDRGLLDQVIVLVMGEFGRTPRINQGQPGIPIPGRDHWGNAISAMIAGGGIRGGQVVGQTNDKAEHPIDRPLRPADLLATVYHLLGIDASQTFVDHSGRPVAILDEGAPVAELV